MSKPVYQQCTCEGRLEHQHGCAALQPAPPTDAGRWAEILRNALSSSEHWDRSKLSETVVAVFREALTSAHAAGVAEGLEKAAERMETYDDHASGIIRALKSGAQIGC